MSRTAGSARYSEAAGVPRARGYRLSGEMESLRAGPWPLDESGVRSPECLYSGLRTPDSYRCRLSQPPQPADVGGEAAPEGLVGGVPDPVLPTRLLDDP